jgi:hypothetical protein
MHLTSITSEARKTARVRAASNAEYREHHAERRGTEIGRRDENA